MQIPRRKSGEESDSTVESQKAKLLLDHDLRSALTDIWGGVQLLDIAQFGAANRTQISRISASASLAIRLLDARENWNMEVPLDQNPQSINVSQMLAEIKPRWVGRIAAQGMELLFKINIDPAIRVKSDFLSLERVLSNILENAAKFANVGRIELAVSQGPDSVIFQVSDGGPGFSKSALDQLFRQGGRPSDSAKPGSGLGLFIASEIVQQLQGQITVKNTEPGAVVTFEVPVHFGEEPVQAPKVESQMLNGRRILLAEDNRTNQIVASQMLRALGAEVVIVADGVQAMEVLQQQSFDLALLDIEMPRKNGLDLIEEIRALETPLAELPLVALTAYAMREHRQRILECGANGIIAKPLISIDTFGREALRHLLDAPDHTVVSTSDKGRDVVDLEVYNALRDAVGDSVFLDFLDKLLLDLEAVEKRLASAFSGQDFGEISSASHVLISLSGAIGAIDLLNSARSLNTACNNGEGKLTAHHEENTQELLAELVAFLQPASNSSNGV